MNFLLKPNVILGALLIIISLFLILDEISHLGFLGKISFYLMKILFGNLRFVIYVFTLASGIFLLIRGFENKKFLFAAFIIISLFGLWPNGVLGQFLNKIFSFLGQFKIIFWLIALGISLYFILPLELKKKIKILKLNLDNQKLKNKIESLNTQLKTEPLLKTKVEIKNQDKEEVKEDFNFSLKSRKYKLPPLDILNQEFHLPQEKDLQANALLIKQTFENFGINVELGPIWVGPRVTQYTVKPSQGTKLTKITMLADNLALTLASHPIRIEAPIPGESLVGIEVPNKQKAILPLGWILKNDDYKKTHPLEFYLGVDLRGKILKSNLARLPHLLISGATGSGKSVFIHTLLTTLLMKNTPETLRLLLVDMKKVELSHYAKIPHLITEPILEAKKTIGAFKWLVEEMERRYQTFLEFKTRDIEGYNLKIQKEKRNFIKFMPYIVMIIDELADLMVLAGKEVENYIIRLTQLARATGIHLVLATQRPSVEIITGLIKANIPAKIAFQVASNVDSRIILDTSGAEKLLGAGDMLVLMPEWSKPKRLQSPFISEKEIKKISLFWQKQTKDEEKIELTVPENKQFLIDDDFEDELYDEALKIVVESQKASTSLLQRKLKIGYARAARLLDVLEERGIVGPAEGSKPRKVLIKKEDLENLYENKLK